MHLRQLHIINYRNIAQADFALSEGINCFVGNNGAGKTNLLDTIYYLSFCKSYFGAPDNRNILHNQQMMAIQGTYERLDAEEVIMCGVRRGQKKQFRRNRKDYQRLAEHIGLLPLVIIAPDDELLIADGSEARRKYADSVISQCNNAYLDTLLRYNRILQQRNALLKQLQETQEPNLTLLDVFDQQLGAYGTTINEQRRCFVEWLRPVLTEHYQCIASSPETIDIQYTTGLSRYELYTGLVESRHRDLELGYTSRGIHKDDIEFTLGGYPIRQVGSQGQRKSFIIALKLAQFKYIEEHNGIKPILLLDDVFDKLDARRGDNLIDLVAHDAFAQIFITDTDKKRLLSVLERVGKDYKIFHVADGVVTEDNDNH